MTEFPPGLILIIGGIFVPLFHGTYRKIYMLALPIVGFWGLTQISEGTYFSTTLFGLILHPVRVDALSLIFGYIFYIAAGISIIYALHLKDTLQQIAGLIYAGAAIGGVFAGDLITLFVIG